MSLSNTLVRPVSRNADTPDDAQIARSFGAEGIELGELGSPFTSLLGNARLSFLQSGVELAYISNHMMYITRAQVADGLTVGSAARGYYDFQTEPNGSLSLVRRSGETEA